MLASVIAYSVGFSFGYLREANSRREFLMIIISIDMIPLIQCWIIVLGNEVEDPALLCS